jgi:hypothetical protein
MTIFFFKGFIKSNDDSGFDHINAHVDPSRYERQVLVFHDAINFKRLGVTYENTVNGRSYDAINLKTAQFIGFDPPMLLLGATDEIYK